MAEQNAKRRNPRIRKSAPTVRERQEAVLAEAEKPKSRRVRNVASSVAKPVRKLKLSDRKVVKIITYPFRMIGKGLYKITPKYFINSWRELRLVVWPSRKETWRLTLAVFVFATVFGALVAVVDKGLDQIFKQVILK